MFGFAQGKKKGMFGFGCVLLPKGKKRNVWFRLCPFAQEKKKEKRRKKKGKRRSRERKTKKGTDVSTSLFAFSLLLSSQLMFFFPFVSFLFLKFCSFFCHFLIEFICCL